VPHPFPHLRWLALVWLAVYLPSYTFTYGLLNFLFMCNLGVMLTAIGLWRGSSLLLSSQALACPMISLAWALDAGGRLLTGQHPFGFTAYMWDPQWSLFTRMLSLYHLAWPVVLYGALRRQGYDPRALALQGLIATGAIVAGRLGGAELNINYAWRDPLVGLAWGPPIVHVGAMLACLWSAIYVPIHLLLLRAFSPQPSSH
jgi:hypothetical protein